MEGRFSGITGKYSEELDTFVLTALTPLPILTSMNALCVKKFGVFRVSRLAQAIGFIATVAALAGCAHGPDSRSSNASGSDSGSTAMVRTNPAASGTDSHAFKYPQVAGDTALSDTEAAQSSADLSDQSTGVPIGTYADVWDRIVAGYALPPLDTPSVAQFEQWFVNNPEYMDRMMERAKLYLYHITEEVEKRGMPMEIALLPAIESAYKPHAYSRAKASGLWQFIPSTGRLYGLKSNWWYDGRRDVVASTGAALDYLQKLHDDFGDWHLAIAAYNCGEGNVARAIKRNQKLGKPTQFEYLKLPRETRSYVPQLVAMANIVANPSKYGAKIPSIPNTEYFAQIETDTPIDLGVAAKLLDMPAEDLYFINPGYRQWLTVGDGPHTLLVPAAKKDSLIQSLNALEDNERVVMAAHTVRKGESITKVARKYGVTVEAIRDTNELGRSTPKAGQTLIIPVSQARLAYAPPEKQITSRSAKRSGGKVRVTHRVRKGETLYSIANRYNVYVKQLREWNFLDHNDVLRAGQKLKIYTRKRYRASLDGEHLG